MIRREDSEGLVILRFQHGKANAVDLEILQALDRELVALDGDPSVRAVVLTGNGRMFSAGVDLFRVVDGGRAYLNDFLAALSSVVERLFLFPRPVVAAVDGHAIAGGCVLALAADRVVMAEGKATIGVTELKVGVPFPVMAYEVLRHRLGDRGAETLVTEASTLRAVDARAAGLVDEVAAAEDLLDRARDQAEYLASIPTPAFVLTKRLARGPVVERKASFADLDAEVLERWCAEDTLQGIRNFLDQFVGKKG